MRKGDQHEAVWQNTEGRKMGGKGKMPSGYPIENMEQSPWATNRGPIGQQSWMMNYEEPLNISWTQKNRQDMEDNRQKDPSWMNWDYRGMEKWGNGQQTVLDAEGQT